jgi:hypothetical protein
METTVKTTSLWIKFAGWFQCRLATDPDPTDEPRGVDGSIHAIAGEQDLDRIIRLQLPGTVQRSYCPTVGVKVVAVYVDQLKINDHPLIDGVVVFLDNPKFEGRNSILAVAGEEAIFPLHIQIKKHRCLIQRKFDDSIKFPPFSQEDRDKFKSLQAHGLNVDPGIIGDETEIFDLGSIWKERISKLQQDLTKTITEIERAAIKSRIESMSISNMRNARFFSIRMIYSMSLTGSAIFEDADGYFPGKPIVLAPQYPWNLQFWCGAWDADAQSGYIVGYVGIPISLCEEKDQVYDALPLNQDLANMISNPLERRL